MKATICAIAKNEEAYIEDWLYYHYNLGFDEITIYDNNSVSKKGNVEQLIKYSNKLTNAMKKATHIVDATGKITYQEKAYNDYVYNNKFDWCLFIDLDEFLHLKHWRNVKEMLSDRRFEDTDAICIIWDTISDDDIVDVPDNFVYNGKLCKNITDPFIRENAAKEWEKIPVYERLKTPSHRYEPYNHKMFVKSMPGVTKISVHHYARLGTRSVCRYSSGAPKRYAPYYHTSTRKDFEVNKDFATLKHYRTKTIREFLRQKYLNQSDAANGFSRTLFVDDYFFIINNDTPEKRAYYNRFHKPIEMNIVVDGNEYVRSINATDLCMLLSCVPRERNPFVVGEQFVGKHINAIDRITII